MAASVDESFISQMNEMIVRTLDEPDSGRPIRVIGDVSSRIAAGGASASRIGNNYTLVQPASVL